MENFIKKSKITIDIIFVMVYNGSIIKSSREYAEDYTLLHARDYNRLYRTDKTGRKTGLASRIFLSGRRQAEGDTRVLRSVISSPCTRYMRRASTLKAQYHIYRGRIKGDM